MSPNHRFAIKPSLKFKENVQKQIIYPVNGHILNL